MKTCKSFPFFFFILFGLFTTNGFSQVIIDSNRVQGYINIEPLSFIMPTLKGEIGIWYGRWGGGIGILQKSKKQHSLFPEFILNYNADKEEIIKKYKNPSSISYLKKGIDLQVKYRHVLKRNWVYQLQLAYFNRRYGVHSKKYQDFDIRETEIKQNGLQLNASLVFYWGKKKNIMLTSYVGAKTGYAQGDIFMYNYTDCIVCEEEYVEIKNGFIGYDLGLQLGIIIGE